MRPPSPPLSSRDKAFRSGFCLRQESAQEELFPERGPTLPARLRVASQGQGIPQGRTAEEHGAGIHVVVELNPDIYSAGAKEEANTKSLYVVYCSGFVRDVWTEGH